MPYKTLEQRNAASRRWREKNKEKQKAAQKRCYEKKKAEYTKIAAEWRKANPEKSRAYTAKWRAKPGNREAANAQNREWYDANRERKSANWKSWYEANKSKRAAYLARYEAARLSATPSWANDFFIEEAYDLARRRSQITGVEWHVDHIVPLKGRKVCGLHTHDNLRVITAHENKVKYNTHHPMFAAPL